MVSVLSCSTNIEPVICFQIAWKKMCKIIVSVYRFVNCIIYNYIMDQHRLQKEEIYSLSLQSKHNCLYFEKDKSLQNQLRKMLN